MQEVARYTRVHEQFYRQMVFGKETVDAIHWCRRPLLFKCLAWLLLYLFVCFSCGCMRATWAMEEVCSWLLGASFQPKLQSRLSLGHVCALLGPHEQQCNVGLEH